MDSAHPLSLSLARQVLFISFLLSQGKSERQHALFALVSCKRPHWTLEQPVAAALPEQMVPAVLALCQRGLHRSLSEQEIRDELARQVVSLQSHLEPPLSLLAEGVSTLHLATVVEGMLIADAHFLFHRGGRARALETPTTSSEALLADPFGSHFCHSLLEGYPTGVAVFDEILAQIRADMQANALWWQRVRKEQDKPLHEVFTVYRTHHPQVSVLLPRTSTPEGILLFAPSAHQDQRSAQQGRSHEPR